MFLQVSVIHSVHRGGRAWQGGGVRGRGVCVAGGRAWQGGHAWQGGRAWAGGGVRGWGGAWRGFIQLGGHAWFYSAGGGIHGFIRGVHGFIRVGHAWFYLGGRAWFYLGGVRGFIWGGRAWFYSGGRAWFFQFFRIQWDTVNERAVRILLECILVHNKFKIHCLLWRSQTGWIYISWLCNVSLLLELNVN